MSLSLVPVKMNLLLNSEVNMLNFDYEGKEFPSFKFLVERCKIKELCMAIGDTNPLFFDKDYAISQGYKDTPVPMTFPTVMNFWGNQDLWSTMQLIGLDTTRLLHAKEDYQYLDVIYPGDELTGTFSVDSMKDVGGMEMVTFKSVFTRDGKEVLIAKMTVVVVNQE